MSAPNANPNAELTALVQAAATSGPDGATLARFVEAFYARVPGEDMAQRPASAWLSTAREFLAFASERASGAPSLRLSNPESSPHTVLQIVNDDMPFLVDSTSMALAEHGIGIHLLVHPVIPVHRDAGRLAAVGEGAAESMMHIEIDRQPAEELAALQVRIEAALADVRACVQDWATMRDTMAKAADDLATRPLPVNDVARAEAQDFLRWAADNHFTFLG